MNTGPGVGQRGPQWARGLTIFFSVCETLLRLDRKNGDIMMLLIIPLPTQLMGDLNIVLVTEAVLRL